VIGEGEEDRPAHPRRDELARLLLERGAEPYDIQVLYNIHFHGEVLWFLELIYDHSMKLGRRADWEDPQWRMLDMGGYGTGARYLLEIAVRKNDVALAEWLLSHGANPDAAHAADPRLPQVSLHEAAVRAGHLELADLLVRHGATPSGAAIDDEQSFVAACLRLDRDRAEALLAEHPEYLRSTAAAFAAAKSDRADVVALLLDLGLSIEVENEQRQRPLHAAAWSDAVRIAELLIELGAEIDPRESEWQNTPIDFAVYGQHRRMTELLTRHSRDIWNLTFVGAVDRVRDVLREQPALARSITKRNETPLMELPDDEAAAVEIVKLFLAHGADAGVRDPNGLTAADHASRRGLVDAAALLLAQERPG
jgi:ankyrin repeat protein